MRLLYDDGWQTLFMVQIQGGRMMNIKDKMEFPDEYEKLQIDSVARAYIRFDNARMHISEPIEDLKEQIKDAKLLKNFGVLNEEEYLATVEMLEKALIIYESALEKAKQAYFEERDK